MESICAPDVRVRGAKPAQLKKWCKNPSQLQRSLGGVFGCVRALRAEKGFK